MPDVSVKPESLLSGVRILDFTQMLAGPFATMILGDLGAEIVKVEKLGEGDFTRSVHPIDRGMSYYFESVNRNKRSIAVDLHKPKGRAVALDLVAKSDVVIDNFRPGVMARLRLGPADLRERNPDVVIVSISGFGAWGVNSSLPSFDIIAQALSGVMSLTGEDGGATIEERRRYW